MNYLKRFFAFWYDFIVGDDWTVAAGVVIAFALSACWRWESPAAALGMRNLWTFGNGSKRPGFLPSTCGSASSRNMGARFSGMSAPRWRR